MSPDKTPATIAPDRPDPSIGRQCKPVRPVRSAVYSTPISLAADTLATMETMKEIDRVFTKYPIFGSRRNAASLRREGTGAGRRRVRRPMARMGLEAIYKRPRLGQPHPRHPVFPYPPRKMRIDRPNRVRCADIAFVPVENGFPYPIAIVNRASRKVPSWRLSNAMRAEFCIDASNEAIAKYGSPGIVNTNRGSQVSGSARIAIPTEAGGRIPMDGRGRYLDNIFIERPGEARSKRPFTATKSTMASRPYGSSKTG